CLFACQVESASGSSTTDPARFAGASDTGDGERDGCADRGDRDDDCRRARVQHVLLISIDGMHEVDLARFIASHPASALAALARTGVAYTSAFVNRLDGTPTNPSDSFPGLLALATGGSSPTHGGWYDVSYARDLFPDATCTTPGTDVIYDESAEFDNRELFGA